MEQPQLYDFFTANVNEKNMSFCDQGSVLVFFGDCLHKSLKGNVLHLVVGSYSW